MSDGSAGWSILEGPFPDGSMVNKLLGAVIANIKRPNQNYNLMMSTPNYPRNATAH